MPTEKIQLSANNIRQFVGDYGIIFKGSVSSSEWPFEHKRHFQTIQSILRTGYDDYKYRTDIDRPTLEGRRKAISELRQVAHALRRDYGLNEETWRDLEVKIFSRFSGETVCGGCGNENWLPEYTATPLRRWEIEKLEAHLTRRRCTCSEPLGEEARKLRPGKVNTATFSTVRGHVVSHDPNDLVEGGYAMHPDRIIGLNMTETYEKALKHLSPNLTSCPVKDVKNILYPFLVFEAKRENNTPGFQSIDNQTAFPIRRFLRIQDDLRSLTERPLDPLVWFFACQGDIWRLSAATLAQDKTVVVYNLWLGTVESEDSALHIFQIVDFIWNWARDVYRSQIRRCLRLDEGPLRGWSPTSTQVFSPTPSVLSDSTVHNLTEPLLGSLNDADSIMGGSEPTLQATAGRAEPAYSMQSDFAPFEKQTEDNSHARLVRSANWVEFWFRTFEVPETADSYDRLLGILSSLGFAGAQILGQLQNLVEPGPFTFLLKRAHIWKIEDIWTESNGRTANRRSGKDPDELVGAFFFMQTLLRPATWRVTRVMHCILWTTRAARHNREAGYRWSDGVPEGRLDHVTRGLRELRSIHSLNSLAWALQNISLVCQNPLLVDDRLDILDTGTTWLVEDTVTQYCSIFDAAEDSNNSLGEHYYQNHEIVQLRLTEHINSFSNHFRLPERFEKTGAVIVVRPEQWPGERPRFCLFIVAGHPPEGTEELRLLTKRTYGAGAVVANPGRLLDGNAKVALRDWVLS